MTFKKILKIIALIFAFVLLIFVLGIVYALHNSNVYEKEQKAKLDGLSISISLDPKYCSNKQFPLFVIVKNNYHKTLKNFKFTIEIYNPGWSNNLNDEKYHQYTWNTITHPNQEFGICYALPKLSEQIAIDKLIFKPNLDSYYINFYESGEFIPEQKEKPPRPKSKMTIKEEWDALPDAPKETEFNLEDYAVKEETNNKM